MKSYLDLGSKPAEEACQQLGAAGYSPRKAEAECHRFIQAIRARCGTEPAGAKLVVKWQSHDFGRYCEVFCEYDSENKKAVAYALKCEDEAPVRWPSCRWCTGTFCVNENCIKPMFSCYRCKKTGLVVDEVESWYDEYICKPCHTAYKGG